MTRFVDLLVAERRLTRRGKFRPMRTTIQDWVPLRAPCPNCGKRDRTGHFVGPSFGQDGFYICQPENWDGQTSTVG